jgi:DNA-binding GntR family transcriptional regulator
LTKTNTPHIVDNRQPTTDNRQPTTDNRQPTTDQRRKRMETIGVSEGVLKFLRVNIITFNFAPGQKLNESELSKLLGVSRSPIREAFRMLEHENLVSSTPRRGVCVNEISIEDCRDIYGVRSMIECYGIECLKEKNIRKLPNINELLADTAHLARPESEDAYAKYEYLREIANFHRQLIVATANKRLLQLFDRIFPSLTRYQSLYTYIPGMMEESQQEHEAVIRCIEKGEFEEGREILRSHIDKFVGIIEKEWPSLMQGQGNGSIDETQINVKAISL